MRTSFGNLVVLKSASERIQEQASEKSSDPKEREALGRNPSIFTTEHENRSMKTRGHESWISREHDFIIT